MKKTLTLILLTSFCVSLFAGSQKLGNFRWRNDDGDMTSATWKAAENTSVEIGQGEVVRLRAELYNETPANFDADNIALHYKGSSDADFIAISNDANNAFVLSLSTFFSEADTINDLLTNSENYPTGGGYTIESTLLKEFLFKNDTSYEVEYCIKSTSNAVQGDTYEFRVDYGTDYFNPNQTIELSISNAAPDIPMSNAAILVGLLMMLSFTVYRFYKP